MKWRGWKDDPRSLPGQKEKFTEELVHCLDIAIRAVANPYYQARCVAFILALRGEHSVAMVDSECKRRGISL